MTKRYLWDEWERMGWPEDDGYNQMLEQRGFQVPRENRETWDKRLGSDPAYSEWLNRTREGQEQK